jgi:hypothetical protein
VAATGWYGKQFIDAESVPPLLFFTEGRAAVFPVDPRKWPSPAIRGLVGAHRAEVETGKYRGMAAPYFFVLRRDSAAPVFRAPGRE